MERFPNRSYHEEDSASNTSAFEEDSDVQEVGPSNMRLRESTRNRVPGRYTALEADTANTQPLWVHPRPEFDEELAAHCAFPSLPPDHDGPFPSEVFRENRDRARAAAAAAAAAARERGEDEDPANTPNPDGQNPGMGVDPSNQDNQDEPTNSGANDKGKGKERAEPTIEELAFRAFGQTYSPGHKARVAHLPPKPARTIPKKQTVQERAEKQKNDAEQARIAMGIQNIPDPGPLGEDWDFLTALENSVVTAGRSRRWNRLAASRGALGQSSVAAEGSSEDRATSSNANLAGGWNNDPPDYTYDWMEFKDQQKALERNKKDCEEWEEAPEAYNFGTWSQYPDHGPASDRFSYDQFEVSPLCDTLSAEERAPRFPDVANLLGSLQEQHEQDDELEEEFDEEFDEDADEEVAASDADADDISDSELAAFGNSIQDGGHKNTSARDKGKQRQQGSLDNKFGEPDPRFDEDSLFSRIQAWNRPGDKTGKIWPFMSKRPRFPQLSFTSPDPQPAPSFLSDRFKTYDRYDPPTSPPDPSRQVDRSSLWDVNLPYAIPPLSLAGPSSEAGPSRQVGPSYLSESSGPAPYPRLPLPSPSSQASRVHPVLNPQADQPNQGGQGSRVAPGSLGGQGGRVAPSSLGGQGHQGHPVIGVVPVHAESEGYRAIQRPQAGPVQPVKKSGGDKASIETTTKAPTKASTKAKEKQRQQNNAPAETDLDFDSEESELIEFPVGNTKEDQEDGDWKPPRSRRSQTASRRSSAPQKKTGSNTPRATAPQKKASNSVPRATAPQKRSNSNTPRATAPQKKPVNHMPRATAPVSTPAPRQREKVSSQVTASRVQKPAPKRARGTPSSLISSAARASASARAENEDNTPLASQSRRVPKPRKDSAADKPPKKPKSQLRLR